MASIIGYDDKIIKQKFIRYKFTCPNCGAIILFEKSEFKHFYDQRDNIDTYSTKCIKCNTPLCTNDLKKHEYLDELEYNRYITGYK